MTSQTTPPVTGESSGSAADDPRASLPSVPHAAPNRHGTTSERRHPLRTKGPGALRTISSPGTASAKLVFLPLWTAAWLFGMVVMILGTQGSAPTGAEPVPLVDVLIGFIGGGLITALVWWGFAPLKRVRMNDRELRISNFRREIVVPLTEVADVTQDSWNHLTTIAFRSDTPFGHSIRVMPPQRPVISHERHPMIGEILAAAAAARKLAARPRSRPRSPNPDPPPTNGGRFLLAGILP
ncbi:MAG: hypothetical protein JW751_03310 [Polyangiaceae bacterium]|nr:hypothetical protein [Polyangiaceae bacterium]